MRDRRRIRILPWLLLAMSASSAAVAAQFVADLAITEDGVVKPGRILVQGERYRLEIEDPRGPAAVVQVLPAEDLCRVLVPRYARYLEIARGEGLARFLDPFQAVESLREHYEVAAAGTEDVAGRTCDREAFRHGDTVVVDRWIARDLAFPVKILMRAQEGYGTELENIELRPVADDLFAVPAGYEQADWDAIGALVEGDPEMRAKREAWEAAQPVKTTLDAMLQAGGELEVLLGPAAAVAVRVKPMDATGCAWTVTALRAGEVVLARTLDGADEVELGADPGADRLILRADEGDAWGEIVLRGRPPLVRATRSVERRDSGGGVGRTLPDGATAFRLRVRSLEEPGVSTLPVRLSLTLEGSRDGSLAAEDIERSLAPGQEAVFERRGTDVPAGFDLSLVAPGGRAELEVTVDRRPPEEQGPF